MQPEIIKKLRLAIPSKILLINLPESLISVFEGLDYDVLFNQNTKHHYNYIHVFAVEQNELENLLLNVKNVGKYDCIFWVSYPKGTGKIKSNIKRETVWNAFELVGLDTVTAVSINETWSALRARPIEKVGTKK